MFLNGTRWHASQVQFIDGMSPEDVYVTFRDIMSRVAFLLPPVFQPERYGVSQLANLPRFSFNPLNSYSLRACNLLSFDRSSLPK